MRAAEEVRDGPPGPRHRRDAARPAGGSGRWCWRRGAGHRRPGRVGDGRGLALGVRLPRNPLGWMLLFVGGLLCARRTRLRAGIALDDVGAAPRRLVSLVRRRRRQGWIWLPPVGLLFTQVLLRFPDGRLPSPRWRVVLERVSIVLLVTGTRSHPLRHTPRCALGSRTRSASDWVVDQHRHRLSPDRAAAAGLLLRECGVGRRSLPTGRVSRADADPLGRVGGVHGGRNVHPLVRCALECRERAEPGRRHDVRPHPGRRSGSR